MALQFNNSKAVNPAIIITNSGALRFDVYEGPFTSNDQFTSSPFTDSFLQFQGVNLSVAEATLSALNDAGANERRSLSSAMAGMMGSYYDSVKGYTSGDVDGIYRAWLKGMDREYGLERREMSNLTLGYVTQDVSKFESVIPLHWIDGQSFSTGLSGCRR